MAIKIANRQERERAKNVAIRKVLDVVAEQPTPPMVRKGRPPSGAAKVAVTLRLNPATVAHYKTLGPDWRSRMTESLERFIWPS